MIHDHDGYIKQTTQVRKHVHISTLATVHSAPVIVADAPGGYLQADNGVHDRPPSELRQRHGYTCYNQPRPQWLPLQLGIYI